MANIGIKIAKKKENVLTVAKKQLQFNSNNYMEKIANIFETAENATEIDFAHGLGYTPTIIDYEDLNSSTTRNRVGQSISRVDNYEVIVADSGAVAGRGEIVYVLFQAGS